MHPIAIATEVACRKGHPDSKHYRIYPEWKLPHFNMEVSAQSLDRTIRFLDKLARALEREGFRFDQPTEKSTRFKLVHVATGMEVSTRIMEPARSIKTGLTEAEKRSQSWGLREKFYRPSGRLQFEINPKSYFHERHFRENTTRKIEDMLPEIIAGCKQEAEAELKRTIERAEREKREKEQEQRRREEERRREVEQERRDLFEKESKNWAKAQRMREFLTACEASLRRKNADGTLSEPARVWVSWATGVIDNLDPILRGYPEAAVGKGNGSSS